MNALVSPVTKQFTEPIVEYENLQVRSSGYTAIPVAQSGQIL